MINQKSILVVDDNPDDSFIAKRAISKCRPDCIVEIATDGAMAIERLQNGTQPSLVLLDLKMPGTDGLGVLSFMRSQEQTRYVPAVMLTSSALEDDIKASYKAGANGYIHKNIDIYKFIDSLEHSLRYWMDLNLTPFS